MYRTDRPFGFLNKDILWIIQNVKNVEVIKDKLDYELSTDKKNKVYVVNGMNLFTSLYLFAKKGKLKGRFIVLDTESYLMKIKAIILDRENMKVDCNAFIKESLRYVTVKKVKKTSFDKERRNFINTIATRVLNQSKVFKKTYQNINLELLANAKKKLSTQKFNQYKKYLSELLCKVCVNYLPYEAISEIQLGKDVLKNKDGFNDVVKYCNAPSTIRTIQAFHDIVLNGTEFNKAVLENYADAYTLNIMLESWKPNSNISFKENYSRKLHNKLNCISKTSLISKELVKARNKKDLIKYSGKFNFKLHKGIIKFDTLIKKLNLPEDEYRVIGSVIKDGKVTIDKTPFAIHGIHTNSVFSIGC